MTAEVEQSVWRVIQLVLTLEYPAWEISMICPTKLKDGQYLEVSGISRVNLQ